MRHSFAYKSRRTIVPGRSICRGRALTHKQQMQSYMPQSQRQTLGSISLHFRLRSKCRVAVGQSRLPPGSTKGRSGCRVRRRKRIRAKHAESTYLFLCICDSFFEFRRFHCDTSSHVIETRIRSSLRKLLWLWNRVVLDMASISLNVTLEEWKLMQRKSNRMVRAFTFLCQSS